MCVRIWDNILAEGTKFIFKVTLSILKLSEHDLLKLDFNGINEYFKSFNERETDGAASPLPDFEHIIREAHRFKITDHMIRQEARKNNLPGHQEDPRRKSGDPTGIISKESRKPRKSGSLNRVVPAH